MIETIYMQNLLIQDNLLNKYKLKKIIKHEFHQQLLLLIPFLKQLIIIYPIQFLI